MKLLKNGNIKELDYGQEIHTADDVLQVVGMSKNKQQLYCKNVDDEIFEIERDDLEAKVYFTPML